VVAVVITACQKRGGDQLTGFLRPSQQPNDAIIVAIFKNERKAFLPHFRNFKADLRRLYIYGTSGQKREALTPAKSSVETGN
jgi:hypothetical protein